MKILLFLFISLSSFSNVLNWDDLKINESYVLSEKLKFEKEKFVLDEEEPVFLTSITTLGMINVTVFRFELETCYKKDYDSEIYMTSLYEDPRNIEELGYAIHDSCNLDLMIETVDFYQNSILEK